MVFAFLALLLIGTPLLGACGGEKIVEVPVEKIVEKEVIKEVPVEVVVEKEVTKEIIKEVPVEKEVVKVVEKPVVVEKEVIIEKEVAVEVVEEKVVTKIVEKEVPVEVTEIVFWYWADTPAIGKLFRDTIDSFNESQKAVRVIGEAQPATLAAREKLAASTVAGIGPDVTYWSGSLVHESTRAGMTRPIQTYFDQWAEKDDMIPTALDPSRSGDTGDLLMLPWGNVVDYYYYRTDMYEAKGVAPPETQDEQFQVWQDMTDAPETYGMGLRGADGIGFQFNVIPPLLAEGVVPSDGEGGSTFDSPTSIEVMKKIAQLYYDGYVQPTAPADRFPQMVAMFQSGKIAQWSASTNHYAMLRGAEGEFEDVIGMVPHPKGSAGTIAPVVGGAGIAMTGVTRKPDAAWKWMTYLVGPDVMAQFGEIAAMTPTRKSVAERPFFQEHPAHKLSSDLAPYYVSLPWWHKNMTVMLYDTVPVMWQQVLLQDLTVEELAGTMADLMRDM